MSELIIPSTLSNAQREDLLSAITRHAGGSVSLVDSSPNRIVFNRPGMPQHIYQGTEDILAFAFESSVNIAEIPPSETLLGAIQEIIDLTAMRDALLSLELDAASMSAGSFSVKLAEHLKKSGFDSDAPHLMADAVLVSIQSSATLATDVNLMLKFPEASDLKARVASALPVALQNIGYLLTTDENAVKELPAQTSDFLPAFSKYLDTLIEHRTPEKFFLQKAHQYAYMRGVSLDVAGGEGYHPAMLRPAASAILRQSYATLPVAERHQQYANLRFLDKSVVRHATDVDIDTYLLEKQSVRWKEMTAIFADGIARANLQNTPDELMKGYFDSWFSISGRLQQADSIGKRLELLDAAKYFVMNGGMYGPESRRQAAYEQAVAQLQRWLLPDNNVSLRTEANEKQVKWRQAYEKIAETIPDDLRPAFLDAIQNIWDSTCPSGEFPSDQRIETVSTGYRRLLADAPVILNETVRAAVLRALKAGEPSIDAVKSNPGLHQELIEKHRALVDSLASLKTLSSDAKPIDLYNTLKENIETLRATSVQLTQLIERSAQYVRENPVELEVLPNSPYQINENAAWPNEVPKEFLETLAHCIHGADTCAPHPLTVGEMQDDIEKSVKDNIRDGLLELPNNFDVHAALDALQSAGVLSVVESLDARLRQFNELKKQEHHINQNDIKSMLDKMSPADKETYHFYAQELNYWSNEIERLSLTTSDDEIGHRRALEQSLNKMKETESGFITFIDRVTGPVVSQVSEEPGTPHLKVVSDDGLISEKSSTPTDVATNDSPTTSVENETPLIAHEMTRKEWIDANIQRSGYGDEVFKDPELYEGQALILRDEWVSALKAQAMKGRIPYKTLDDYVAHYGISALQSEFRGNYERGVAGYEPPMVRLWDKSYAQVLAMHKDGMLGDRRVNNVKALHRHCVAVALHDGFPVPPSVLSEYPEITPSTAIEKFVDDEAASELVVEPITEPVTETSAVEVSVPEPVVVPAAEPAVEVLVAEPVVEVSAADPVVETVAFSDHSQISSNKLLRPLQLEAETLLEQAFNRMFNGDELVLDDEESFLMEQFDRLIERAVENGDVAVLARNLEEFKQLVAPIKTEKNRQRITEWFQHGFEVVKAQQEIQEKLPALSDAMFSDLTEDVRLVGLLSETFRKHSAGENLFILQTISETSLGQLRQGFERECMQTAQRLKILRDPSVMHSLQEDIDRVARKEQLLSDLRTFHSVRVMARQMSLQSKEHSAAIGAVWQSAVEKHVFGESAFFQAVRELQGVLSSPDAFEVMKAEMVPALPPADYLTITAEPGVKSEVTTKPLQKRRSYGDEFGLDDSAELALSSHQDRRMRM